MIDVSLVGVGLVFVHGWGRPKEPQTRPVDGDDGDDSNGVAVMAISIVVIVMLHSLS